MNEKPKKQEKPKIIYIKESGTIKSLKFSGGLQIRSK